jgi:ABC-type phosphate transport system substrate-binding protein
MSLVDQSVGGRQGQADDVLYRLAAAQNYSQCNGSRELPAGNTRVFNDVTVGNNAVPGESGFGTTSAQYQSGVAYDSATGLGSVNVANLINAWSSGFNATTTTLTVPGGSAINITHGASASFDVNVTSNGGTPTGEVALIANTSQSSGTQTGLRAPYANRGRRFR